MLAPSSLALVVVVLLALALVVVVLLALAPMLAPSSLATS
jgi:hypothetical protein